MDDLTALCIDVERAYRFSCPTCTAHFFVLASWTPLDDAWYCPICGSQFGLPDIPQVPALAPPPDETDPA